MKRVADSLGEARDLDVMIQTVLEMCEKLPEEQRSGVMDLIDSLRAHRLECQDAMVSAVERIDSFDPVARFTAAYAPELAKSVETTGSDGESGT